MNNFALQLSKSQRTRFQDLGQSFMAKILETELQRYPDNVDALIELGQVYTQQGRYTEGLTVDQQLAEHLPDNPTVLYNLACSLSLLSRTDDALDALECAIDVGYDDASFMLGDRDLDNVKHTERFQGLVAQLDGPIGRDDL
ncbi:MAG: tetratricopeptide (TPR) repeat protein [Chlamydiales bacterium]|jgi:tetratricopeptide (TPR) repeat protein